MIKDDVVLLCIIQKIAFVTYDVCMYRMNSTITSPPVYITFGDVSLVWLILFYALVVIACAIFIGVFLLFISYIFARCPYDHGCSPCPLYVESRLEIYQRHRMYYTTLFIFVALSLSFCLVMELSNLPKIRS